MTWRVITRYKPNRSGMTEIATGHHLRTAVTEIGTKAKAFAELTAPEGFEGYQYQFELDVDVIPDIPFRRQGEPMERVAAALVNQSRLAVLVEVGSSKSEEYRILGRTVRWIDSQAGLSK